MLILFLHWRARQGLGGWVLLNGWALVAIGAAPWFFQVSPERGLAIAALAPMMAGFMLLAPDGLARVGAGAARKKERNEATPLETETSSPGRISRNIARWIGALTAVPALGLAAAAAWQAFFPGAIADRFAGSIFALMIAWTAALLWLLSTARPWLATTLVAIAAAAFSGGAYSFVTYGQA